MTQTYNKCQIEACGSEKDLMWHEDGGEVVRMCRTCHIKMLVLQRKGMSKVEALTVLSVSTDIDFSKAVTRNTKLVSARIPLPLLSKKRKSEKDTEFVIRAIESIDKQGMAEDPFLITLAKKMIRLFVEKNMKLKLDSEEIEIVKRLYEP